MLLIFDDFKCTFLCTHFLTFLKICIRHLILKLDIITEIRFAGISITPYFVIF